MAANRTWGAECDRQLILNWSKMTHAALAEMLGCDVSTIGRRAKKLRALGVSLPEKKPAAAPKVQKTPKDVLTNPIIIGGTWPDGWRINPPTLARLRAGR